jgi:hypothetical protein
LYHCLAPDRPHCYYECLAVCLRCAWNQWNFEKNDASIIIIKHCTINSFYKVKGKWLINYLSIKNWHNKQYLSPNKVTEVNKYPIVVQKLNKFYQLKQSTK